MENQPYNPDETYHMRAIQVSTGEGYIMTAPEITRQGLEFEYIVVEASDAVRRKVLLVIGGNIICDN